MHRARHNLHATTVATLGGTSCGICREWRSGAWHAAFHDLTCAIVEVKHRVLLFYQHHLRIVYIGAVAVLASCAVLSRLQRCRFLRAVGRASQRVPYEQLRQGVLRIYSPILSVAVDSVEVLLPAFVDRPLGMYSSLQKGDGN